MEKLENNKLFVYGILKRGFSADLVKLGQKFLGVAQIPGAILYKIGGGVGLRFTDDLKQIAHGELFEINPNKWPWLDSIEANGFAYTRKIVPVFLEVNREKGEAAIDNAWVYEHTYPGHVYKAAYEDGIYRPRWHHGNV